MHWYRIFPELRLVIGGYKGAITVEDMRELALAIWKDPLYDKTYSGIVDCTQASMDISPEGIRRIADFFISQNDTLTGKAAVLVQTPMETAINWIFAKHMGAKNKIGVFSTWKAATDFLKISPPEEIVPQHLLKK